MRELGRVLGLGLICLGVMAAVKPTLAVLTPEVTFQASGATSNGAFGGSVDLDNGRLIVGANLEEIPGGFSQDGAVYIFERATITQWVQMARLPSPNQTVTYFGDTNAVSIHDNVAVVGAPSPSGTIGQAYVYRDNGGTWILEQTLNRPGSFKNKFGDSVAVRGSLIVVGDTQHAGLFAEGSIHIYRFNGTSWVLEQQFFDPWDHSTGFGGDVDLDPAEDVIIAGVWGINNSAGQARIYRKTGTWSLEDSLVPDDPEAGANFGISVGIDGDWAVVGAERSQVSGGGRGAAYIFHRQSGTNWVQTQKIVAPGLSSNARFGRSVAIQGDRIVVGAALDRKAWVYQRTGNTWSEVDRLEYSGYFGPSQLGGAVALDSDIIAVGDQNWVGPSQVGAMSIFRLAVSSAVPTLAPYGVAALGSLILLALALAVRRRPWSSGHR